MTGGWPISGSFSNALAYNLPAVTFGVNSKGVWSGLPSGMPFDVSAIAVPHSPVYSSGNTICAVDFGVGPAGSESVIISNVVSWYYSQLMGAGAVLVPVKIPYATRVAVRAQLSSSVSGQAFMPPTTMLFFAGGFTNEAISGVVDSLGFQTSVTYGSVVIPALNAKGNWSTIMASTAYDYAGFWIMLDPTAAFNSPANTILLDVGIGAVGSENVLVSNWSSVLRLDGYEANRPSSIFWSPIKAGTRIAARAQVENTAANFGCTIYGIRK